MRQFVKEIRAIGAVPILITAPRKSEIPNSYVDNNQAHSTEEFKQDHDRYAEIVRDVCQETGAQLLDMQRIIVGPEWDGHFAADAIHFDAYDREGSIALGSEEQPARKTPRLGRAFFNPCHDGLGLACARFVLLT